MDKNRHFPANAVRVCIDGCEDGVKGRVFNKLSKEPLPFADLAQLFLQVDKLFDACGYPQAFQEKRSFGEAKNAVKYARPREVLGDDEIFCQAGEYRTIDLLIKSRRNAGWQGSILNEEGKPVLEFQSEIDLLRRLGLDKEIKEWYTGKT